ncbi:hypothetical protein [Streptomyces sp. NPDC058457]|uniref:hypothetical protein n=1 Tax=Streptomyces sp. NPDC058457 TaxID=3346507 RepID=UPI003667C68C
MDAGELPAGIRTVAAGDSLLSPAATRSLISDFLATPDTDDFLALPEAVKALTTAKREVTALAAYASPTPRSSTSWSSAR